MSLALAIPGPEFIVGLRLWLGFPFFPLSPLCMCLAPIDQFGDHLLECFHGPMRIRSHDALVEIICEALSQNHPGVLKEQCVSVTILVMCITLIFSMAILLVLIYHFITHPALSHFFLFFLCWSCCCSWGVR